MTEPEIKAEDLPEVYRFIAEECGMDVVIKISKLYGGGLIYFPKYETIIIPARNRAIISEFNGRNAKEVARKHGLTENAVRDIVRLATVEDDKQYTLWDNGIL